MEMKISLRKDAMGSFIHAMVHDHLLDAVAFSIRKRPHRSKFFPSCFRPLLYENNELSLLRYYLWENNEFAMNPLLLNFYYIM